MELFGRKKLSEHTRFERHIKLQQETELDTLRSIKECFEQRGEQNDFLINTVRRFGTFPVHEDYTLSRLVHESRENAEMFGHEEPQLWQQYAYLHSAEGIAAMRLGLHDPYLEAEQKTLLKEAAQLQVFAVCGSLEDHQFDAILDYLDALTPEVTGIDFTDQASIDAALEAVDR